MRRRRRLRLIAASRRCSRRAATLSTGAVTGGESAASGGALTLGRAPQPVAKRLSADPGLDRATDDTITPLAERGARFCLARTSPGVGVESVPSATLSISRASTVPLRPPEMADPVTYRHQHSCP